MDALEQQETLRQFFPTHHVTIHNGDMSKKHTSPGRASSRGLVRCEESLQAVDRRIC